MVQFHQKSNHICPHCGKGYGLRRELEDHEKIVHLKIRPHKCEICEATFFRPKGLKIHVKNVHSGDERYSYFFHVVNFR